MIIILFRGSKSFLIQDIVWSSRVSPYNRPGCVGIKILCAGIDDEGLYVCSVNNSMGQASFSATLLVECKYYLCMFKPFLMAQYSRS